MFVTVKRLKEVIQEVLNGSDCDFKERKKLEKEIEYLKLQAPDELTQEVLKTIIETQKVLLQYMKLLTTNQIIVPKGTEVLGL